MLSQGNLSSMWLGGMSNPGSLLLALCQEKAVLHDVSLNQVRIRCVIPSENGDVMEQEAGMFIEDIHVINARLGANGGELCTGGFSRFTRDLRLHPTPSVMEVWKSSMETQQLSRP